MVDMPHLVLVGDGTLANQAHTGTLPDSAAVARQLLSGWSVSVLAVEGAALAAVPDQLKRLPSDASLVVLSAGGNDAMEHVELLQRPSESSGETLDALIAASDAFGKRYRQVIEAAKGKTLRLVLCTIYEPPLVGPNTASRARAILTLLNDQILRTAHALGVDVIELRDVVRNPGDFTLQIHPSGAGAAKIGRAIANAAGISNRGGVAVISS